MSLRHGVLYGLKGTHFRVLFGIWGDFFAARCCISLMFQENGCLSPWYKGINTYIPLPIVFIHCNFHWCQLLTNRVFCSLPGDLSQLGIMLVSIIDLWNIMICHTNNLCLSMAKYIWSNNSRNIPYMVSMVLMTPDQAILPTVLCDYMNSETCLKIAYGSPTDPNDKSDPIHVPYSPISTID